MFLQVIKVITAIPQVAKIFEGLFFAYLEWQSAKQQDAYDQKKAQRDAAILALKNATTDEEIAKYSRLLYDLNKSA
jgi:hypothetical protein